MSVPKDVLHTAADQLTEILDPTSCDSAHEARIHQLFTTYPFLLPGVFDLHNGPVGGVVISKPPLGDFIPDFAFATTNSMEARLTLIEIEDPCKRIFTRRDEFTQEFNHALQQVRDWLGQRDQWRTTFWAMLSKGLKRSHAEGSWTVHKTVGVLVFGRRSEIDSPKRGERWSSVATWPLQVMTYDRLFDFRHDLHWKIGGEELKNKEGLRTVVYRDRSFAANAGAKEPVKPLEAIAREILGLEDD